VPARRLGLFVALIGRSEHLHAPCVQGVKKDFLRDQWGDVFVVHVRMAGHNER
jgi:hypothetical protein